MKKALATLFAVFALSGFALADKPEPSDNLGALTSYAIHLIDDWDQGVHSSDPLMDGLGYEARVGLANVLSRGDLAATVAFLADLIFPD
jgi:hypothetical protein